MKNGTKYGILIRAQKASGAYISYTVDDVRYATPNSNMKVTSVLEEGNGQINVLWNGISGATGYRIYIYQNGAYKRIADTTSTSYTITDLTNGTQYGVLVRAQKVDGSYATYTEDDVVYATPKS